LKIHFLSLKQTRLLEINNYDLRLNNLLNMDGGFGSFACPEHR
jgi:hypothetical protein